MFYGDDNYDVFEGILSFYGQKALEEYIEKFKLTVSEFFADQFLDEDLGKLIFILFKYLFTL